MNALVFTNIFPAIDERGEPTLMLQRGAEKVCPLLESIGCEEQLFTRPSGTLELAEGVYLNWRRFSHFRERDERKQEVIEFKLENEEIPELGLTCEVDGKRVKFFALWRSFDDDGTARDWKLYSDYPAPLATLTAVAA